MIEELSQPITVLEWGVIAMIVLVVAGIIHFLATYKRRDD